MRHIYTSILGNGLLFQWPVVPGDSSVRRDEKAMEGNNVVFLS